MDPESERPRICNVTPFQQIVASCTGAILTSLMVTPLDVVKIRLQAQNNQFSKGKCFVYNNGLMDHLCICEEEGNKAWYKKPGYFRGTLDAFLKIIRNEGIKSLWSGLPPTLVMAVPATVIYFTCYDQLTALLKSKLGENERHIPIVAGIVARFGAVTVISPLELIRTKMQSKRFSYNELHQFVSKKVSKDGWISLWSGWAPTLLRDVPFSVSIPMPLHMSTWAIMKNIVAKNGFSGLFTGLTPRLIKIAPACAIMISTYEFGKAFFHKQNTQKQQL
ncbi:probable mitochondrial glutathione transporter SLC25A40 isoform X2 [Eptesicus fuscus]|uniref:probable mitochondrial glutathione transporter SLC25A40 isoform X2 n=1 Tax=Eptesicus fuscus TaxID=29078 RepID=UPI0024041509|nr:probable mitochondrial glutathione transporter SLC25A40 isoform X2 [Eptesicus fuscus]